MLNPSIHPQHYHNEKASQQSCLKETAIECMDIRQKYEEIIQEAQGN